MTENLLACGPYFSLDEAGTVVSLVIFLLVKPLTYFAYVRAFRYRVSRAIPMTIGQAAKIAIYRALLGIFLVGGGTFFFIYGLERTSLIPSWVYLYLSRIVAWYLIGKFEASLRGHRLLAWTFFGLLINVAFDVAVVAGYMGGWEYLTVIVAIIAAFVYVLEVRGRRFALVSRFMEAPFCKVCEYNLTGNLSGICPECGTLIPDFECSDPSLS